MYLYRCHECVVCPDVCPPPPPHSGSHSLAQTVTVSNRALFEAAKYKGKGHNKLKFQPMKSMKQGSMSSLGPSE